MLQFKWIPLKLKDYQSLYLDNTFKQRNKITSLASKLGSRRGGKVKRILKMKIKRKKLGKKKRKKTITEKNK